MNSNNRHYRKIFQGGHMKVFISFLFLCCFLVPVFSSDQEPLNSEAKPVQYGKILVVYYSRTGTTKEVAQEIASKLNADIEEIIDKKDRSGVLGFFAASKDAKNENLTELAEMKKNPKEYNLIIIGTPVWDETVSTPVRTYLIKYKDSLPEKVAFFTTSRATEAEIVVKKMEKIIGKSAVSFTGFSSFIFSDYLVGDFDIDIFMKGFRNKHKLVEEVFKKMAWILIISQQLLKKNLKTPLMSLSVSQI
jgi:flavodoxin